MGTRADFYVGRHKNAEWLGSIAWDGYWDGIDLQVLQCTSEAAFRYAVADFIKPRKDGTTPEMGWPWPWDDSGLTDCAYAFDAGKTWQEFDGHWVPAEFEWDGETAIPDDALAVDWPDMSARKSMTLGPRSGVIVVGL